MAATAAAAMEQAGRISRNSTLICVPTIAGSVDEMLIDMQKAKLSVADLVEIRLDCLKSFAPLQDLQTLIRGCPLPTLFTYRPKWEGGQYDGDETVRLDALRLAMDLGADYVDVELQVAHEFNNSIRGKKPKGFKLIVSNHNYQNTPSVEDLVDLVAQIQAAGADIVKIATTVVDICDVARIFQITVNSQLMMDMVPDGEELMPHRVPSDAIPHSQEQPPSQPVGTQDAYPDTLQRQSGSIQGTGESNTRKCSCGRIPSGQTFR